MLSLTIKPKEFWDEQKEEFIMYPPKPITLKMEYSLLALSKWEEKHCKPFLDKKKKTEDEYLDFLICMCIAPPKDPNVFKILSDEETKEIEAYIKNPHTATVVRTREKPHKKQIVTSEVLYAQMAQLQIPFSCEKWNLHRLTKLIEVAAMNNAPPDKMSKGDILRQNAAINAKRRKPRKP